MNMEQDYYNQYIDEKLEDVWEISKYIHLNPEIGFKEYKASKIQCDFLRKQGFEVQQGVDELDTAFVATYGSGKPAICIVSEYDALEGLGHACGHNLICATSILTGDVIREYLSKHPDQGCVKVIGTPAEEGGGGKIKLLKKGVFENIDSVFMMHPTSYKTKLAGRCLSVYDLKITFYGQSAQAASHPEEGRSALSAANLYLTACGLWKQQLSMDTRINQIIEQGGIRTNIVPDKVVIKSNVRCFSASNLEKLVRLIKNCAIKCADAMECTVEIAMEEGYQGRVPNCVLSDICREEFVKLDEPLMDGLVDDYGGEDLGNVSHYIPICNPYVTIYPDRKISGHTDKFRELAISDSGLRCIQIASKAMAQSIIRLYQKPNLIELAKKELKERLQTEN